MTEPLFADLATGIATAQLDCPERLRTRMGVRVAWNPVSPGMGLCHLDRFPAEGDGMGHRIGFTDDPGDLDLRESWRCHRGPGRTEPATVRHAQSACLDGTIEVGGIIALRRRLPEAAEARDRLRQPSQQ